MGSRNRVWGRGCEWGLGRGCPLLVCISDICMSYIRLGMYILFACVCVYVFGGVRTNRFSVDNSGNTFIILVLLLLAF